jgi:hypothetical protein
MGTNERNALTAHRKIAAMEDQSAGNFSLAEALLALRRIDPDARSRWLFDRHDAGPVTGRARMLDRAFNQLFHITGPQATHCSDLRGFRPSLPLTSKSSREGALNRLAVSTTVQFNVRNPKYCNG